MSYSVSTSILTYLLTIFFINICTSDCPYFNSGGIGIPLNYCHVLSNSGTLTPVRWSCTANDELYVDVWYNQQTCTGTAAYSSTYDETEEIDDYNCDGDVSDCYGVVLKMYDDSECESSTWSQMKIITDHCFEGENMTSTTLECDSTKAEIFKYKDAICTNSSFFYHTTTIESTDRCTQVISCDDPHQSLGTNTPSPITVVTSADQSSTPVPITAVTSAGQSTTSTTNHQSNTCSYVNLGGTGIPLGYCHLVSTLIGSSAYSYSCSADNIVWNHFMGETSCVGNASMIVDPSSVYTVEDYECNGDQQYCNTVEVKVYTNLNGDCSGSLYTVSEYVTDQCFEAADGGSHEYFCTEDAAGIKKYSDDNCQYLLNITRVEDNCYEILSCSNPTSANYSTLVPSLVSVNTKKWSIFILIAICVALIIVVGMITSIIVCCRRRSKRLEQQIAHMSVNSESSNNYVLSSVNDEQLLVDEGGFANQIVSVDEENNDVRSDVVITAYAF